MVAWHDKDGNSYWVCNTLVQTLDNADMIAVARAAHGNRPPLPGLSKRDPNGYPSPPCRT